MELGMHAGCIMYTNVLTDIRIAREVGYDAIELWIPKLERYLDQGYPVEDLRKAMGPLKVNMLNCLMPIEIQEPQARKQLLNRCERLCQVAQGLNCKTLQAVVLNELIGEDWPSQRKKIAASLRELADIAGPHGVRLGCETVVFTPFNTLQKASEVFDLADRENLRLVVDTFHLWTAGVSWDEVAQLDSQIIVSVHLSDTNPRRGAQWDDDDRTALLGEGILPLREGIQAILNTGYDGCWAVEMLSRKHWEWDPQILASELKRRTQIFLLDEE